MMTTRAQLRHTDGHRVELVVKVAERCNINCSYCYMFRESQLHADKPVYIKEAIYNDILDFIEKGIDEVALKEAVIIFHGGEPLMIGVKRFAALCDMALARLGPHMKVTFRVQTNGMLVTEKWIEVFARYQISVGVSLDGPKQYHDVYRLDHQGRGTYDRVVTGLSRLVQAKREGRISGFGVLVVVNPDVPTGEIYRHLVDDLGVTGMNFLLPSYSHDTLADPELPEKVRWSMESLLDEWESDREAGQDIHVSMLSRAYQRLGSTAYDPDLYQFQKSKTMIASVASDGSIGPEDTLREIREDWFGVFHVKETSLSELWLRGEEFGVDDSYESIPSACSGCTWRHLCRGGKETLRYGKARGFDNRSIYCETYQMVYERLAEIRVREGSGALQLTRALGLELEEAMA